MHDHLIKMSIHDREALEKRVAADHSRYEKENTEYNHTLDIDKESNTDHEETAGLHVKDEKGVVAKTIKDSLKVRSAKQAWQRYPADHRSLHQELEIP
ncbi:MAG: hypothetical protein Q9209_001001 [Squamulea sp. 1 TL-2023]